MSARSHSPAKLSTCRRSRRAGGRGAASRARGDARVGVWSRARRRRDRQWVRAQRVISSRDVLAVGIKLPCGGGNVARVLCRVNSTREAFSARSKVRTKTRDREAGTTARAHRSPRELAELVRLYTGTSREVLGDDLHRHPVSRPRPFAVHEGHRVVGGRPVDEYEQRGQAARNVSPFFGRGECLSGGASGVVRTQFLTLWYGRAHG